MGKFKTTWWMAYESRGYKRFNTTQIKDKFALPNIPKFVGEVTLPKGSNIRMGEVNPLFENKGGGIQFDLKGQFIGEFKELGKSQNGAD